MDHINAIKWRSGVALKLTTNPDFAFIHHSRVHLFTHSLDTSHAPWGELPCLVRFWNVLFPPILTSLAHDKFLVHGCWIGLVVDMPHTSLKYRFLFTFQNKYQGTSLVVQWLRIRLPMQGTRVRALVWEDPTCRGATKPVRHNYWAWALEPASHNYWAHVLQLLKPARLEPVLRSKRSHRNEKLAHRSEE